MNALRASLRLNGDRLTEEERKKTCFDILYLEDECIEIWDRQDHYQATGEIKSKPVVVANAVEIKNLGEAVKRQNTLRTYLSRYKGKPDKKALLDKYNAELIEIENYLRQSL